jgi:cytochrome c oxidase assembly protein subunit 15
MPSDPSRIAGFGSRIPHPSSLTVRRAALFTLLALVAVVVTGAAVRLSGSGLGCPTWPHCSGTSLTAGRGIHRDIELGNRIITLAVFLGVAATLLLVLWLRPLRPDLRRLSWGLVAGYVGQAVLGGITVLTRLNPLTVAAHFLLSMGLVWIALVLYRRSGVHPVDPQPVVGAPMRMMGRVLAANAAVVLVVGTLVTGTGPHAGARVDNRLPFALRAITQLHSDFVLLLVGMTVATCVALRMIGAPGGLQRRANWLIGVMLAQTAVGFAQYFLGLPAALVEVHVFGATLLWTLTLAFALDMWERPPLPHLGPDPAVAVARSGAALGALPGPARAGADVYSAVEQ